VHSRASRLRLLALFAALVLGALCLATGALAADQTDPSFGQNGVAEVALPAEAHGNAAGILDLAAAPEGRMVAAIGNFAGYWYFSAARFDRDGVLDTSFGTGGFTKAVELSKPGRTGPQAQAQAIAMQPDGKIVEVGYQESFDGGQYSPVLVRYLANGSLDRSFGGDGLVAPRPPFEGGGAEHGGQGGDILHDVAIQPGGRIVAVGTQNEHLGGRPAGLIIAYTPEGKIDRSFGKEGRVLFPHRRVGINFTALMAVKVLRSAKVLVAGYRNDRLFLARLDRNGELDRSFGAKGNGTVAINAGIKGCCPSAASLAVQRDGRILVQGNYGLILARFKADGTLDRSFGRRGFAGHGVAGSSVEGYDMALQGDGRIVVAGFEARVAPNRHIFTVASTARYLPSGKPDSSFGIDGVQALPLGHGGGAFAALTQPDGQVVIGGGIFGPANEGSSEDKLLLTRFLSGSGG
jgi:uncharacterized delta-60 repeat protein